MSAFRRLIAITRGLLYIEIMRSIRSLCGYVALLGTAFLFNGCGGRAINKKMARDVILQSRAEALTRDDVEVLAVTQAGSGTAVVSTNLRAAFRIEKVGGEWVVREVRLGNGQWENLDAVLLALQRVKIDETRRLLEQIGSAIEAYRQKNGRLPAFQDYVQLSDALYPSFMSPLVRLDAWNRPLAAVLASPNSIRLVSAGPDGKMGTPDDIELLRTYLSHA
jgi:hypothetical protein